MEAITIAYLVFMFLAIYMFAFFIILTIKNRKNLFDYPEPEREYMISVLIPAHNEEKTIAETIKHVMNFNYPKKKLEVLAINSASSDNTVKIVKNLIKKYKNLKLVDVKEPGKALALNKGLEVAKGELFAVVDSDSFPSPDSLRKLTGFYNDPKMGAVTSFVTIRDAHKSFLLKLQAMEFVFLGWTRKLLDYVNCVYVTNGPLSLYRKKYVKEVGGFDSRTVTEDVDITWNLMSHGYATAMCLGAKVTTVVPAKLKPWFRQRVRWGLGGLQAIFKYKKMFLRKGMFGIFVLPFVAISIIVSIASFLLTVYVLGKAFILRALVTSFSIISDAPLLQMQNINLIPSVMIFYLLFLFIFSIVFYHYILYRAGFEEKLSIKRFFKMFFYMVVYLTLYPAVWFHAIYRFVIRDFRW